MTLDNFNSRKCPANGKTLASPRQMPLVKFRWAKEQVIAYQYRRDQGQVFRGRFALNCETEVVEWPLIPQLALVGASDGKTHYVIHPDDVESFVLAHRQNTIVCHNVAVDFWAIHRHLTYRKNLKARHVWTETATKGRFRDTMLLDMLLSVAGGQAAGEHIGQRDVGLIAEQYIGLQLDKDNPYRTRYSEIIGLDWAEVAAGFFRYAIKDPIETARVYGPMLGQAKERLKAACATKVDGQFKLLPDVVRRFGVLTEKIQVSAAIALAAVSRTGMHVDVRQLASVRQKSEQRVLQLAESITRRYPGVFRLDHNGQFLLTPQSSEPSKSEHQLVKCFLAAAAEIEAKTGLRVIVPRTGKGSVSTAAANWEHLVGKHPFIDLWRQFADAVSLRRFLGRLSGRRVHPHYRVLTLTGRASCSSPNIQQIPREDAFHELIAPTPGHLLLAVGYKVIELVTLAAVCETRFGHSRLADVIREGVDPHCYTAAMLLGPGYQKFMRQKQRQPEEFKRCRLLAKSINFGVPGGMDAKALIEYARTNYGVEMTDDEAQRFHQRLVEEVYPELKLYLADASMESLARNLKVDVASLWSMFASNGDRSPAISGSIRKIVEGVPVKADGQQYSEQYVRRIWDGLIQLNANAAIAAALNRRTGSTELAAQLFFTAVPTVTGRVRGGVTYTSERSTQFQGLAADGAKLALARLVLAGYRVVGFVNDEILIELPDEGGYVSHAAVEGVLAHARSGMEEVTCGVPVECEYTVASCWSKRAELTKRGDKILAWRPS